jgi:hypothetical protein
MSLLQPRDRGEDKCAHYTLERHKELPQPHHRRSAGPKELHQLIQLIHVFLTLDIELAGARVLC